MSDMLTLGERHEAYLARWKAQGKPTTTFPCPSCTREIERTMPPEGENWSSCCSCPHCLGLYFFVVAPDGVVSVTRMFDPDEEETDAL